MQNDLFGIILAGGSGSRLWPLSRELYPKQFLSFSEDNTLLQQTYLRLKQFMPPENILTVANEKHVPGISFQLGQIEKQIPHNILGEPVAKNTAPALALGTYFIRNIAKDDNPVILVAPSDHLIKDDKNFTKAVLEGAKIARQGFIVTFGIKPSSAETGYGYIKVLPDQKVGDTGLKTDCFKEKPDYETALQYVESGEYYWNSGIFMFSLSTILEEFEGKEPEIINKIRGINLEKRDSLRGTYENLPSISIDYAVMEKSDRIVLIPAEFDWNDLGSWEAIYSVSENNSGNNVVKGNITDIDCENSLIYSSSRCVCAIGIKDTIVVETDDAVLVCDRKDSQRVKEAFDSLKKAGSDLYKRHKTLIEEWGSIINFTKDSNSSINNITINENKQYKVNNSDKNPKHYYITRGTALIKTTNEVKTLNQGQSLDLNDEISYIIENPGSENLELIEITRL